MSAYVFDTVPLLAFLYTEPGHRAVADRLDEVAAGGHQGFLAEVNASELLYLIARIEGDDGTATADSLRVADRDIRALTRHSISIERAPWQTVGEMKAAGALALGDAHAVALAHEREATLVVGADDDFDALSVDIDVERFRDHGV